MTGIPCRKKNIKNANYAMVEAGQLKQKQLGHMCAMGRENSTGQKMDRRS